MIALYTFVKCASVILMIFDKSTNLVDIGAVNTLFYQEYL